MSLLSFFTTGQIDDLNDSFYANERYDELFELQQRATNEAERKAYIQEMQEIFYGDAPYHVVYYDNELHAYRTDKFAGWTNQPPASGTPLFGYGYPGYLALTDAAAATPAPTEAPATEAASDGGAATPAASAEAPESTGDTGTDNTMLFTLIAVGLVAVVVIGGLAFARSRKAAGPRTTSDGRDPRPLAPVRRGGSGDPPRPTQLARSTDHRGRPVHPAASGHGDHDCPHHPAQLRPVPDDAGVAGPHPARAHAGGDPASSSRSGNGGGSTSRCSRTSSSRTSRRRCQGDLGYSYAARGQSVADVLCSTLAHAPAVRARRADRHRPRPGGSAPTRAGNAAAPSTTSATGSR